MARRFRHENREDTSDFHLLDHFDLYQLTRNFPHIRPCTGAHVVHLLPVFVYLAVTYAARVIPNTFVWNDRLGTYSSEQTFVQ